MFLYKEVLTYIFSAACDWSCNEGHKRCFRLAPPVHFEYLSCCNFYHNSICVAQCPSPFVVNIDNECICPMGTTGDLCEKGEPHIFLD